MKKGGLVHDSLMVKLIVGELSRRGYLESKPTHAAGLISASTSSASSPLNSSDLPSASFLLDGFPRTHGQARKLDEEVSMNFVVNIDVPSEVIIERISNRLVVSSVTPQNHQLLANQRVARPIRPHLQPHLEPPQSPRGRRRHRRASHT